MTYASRLRNGMRMPSTALLRRMILEFELDSGATWAAFDGGPNRFSSFLRQRIWNESEPSDKIA